LLVVIAIIGILIALLLPAVQAAREAARRSQCTNNLKQIGIGLHDYHDSFKTFPPSAIEGTNVKWAWGTLILPYVEQGPLYDQLAPNRYTAVDVLGMQPGHDLVMTRIEGYLCPSDDNTRQGRSVYFTASTFRNGLSTGYLGKSNYVMSESVGADTNAPNGPHQIAEIRDGTSNVMHVAEKDEVERVAASAFIFTRSTASVGFRVVSPLNSLNQGTDGAVTYDDTQQICARYRVGSMHPGGANILFCDGSVHFISETVPAAQGNGCGNSYATDIVHKYDPINPEQWQKLFGKKDGQPIDPL
jgi:prepilin-type processing-associated H-X9-DG protein